MTNSTPMAPTGPSGQSTSKGGQALPMPPDGEAAPGLKRSLTLTHAVLYGMGVTVGAGIYVLIGAAAARAGMHAPLAFLVAAIIMGFTGASFAELGSRMPVAAGEAAYVREGFRSPTLATLIGLLVIAIAIVSAAAISVGAAGYIAVFLPLPEWVLVSLVVVAMGMVACWGIVESVTLAGVMTAIEVGGLLMIVAFGFIAEPDVIRRLPELAAPTDLTAIGFWTGLMSASLLAVFAFIGFESLANIAEEIEAPQRTLPRAIFWTLILTTLLYMLVVWVALVAVPVADLAASKAPLALVFHKLTGGSPLTMSAIAIIATLNGIIVQLIMASRVAYGLSQQGSLPRVLAAVHPVTRTPLNATLIAMALTLALALVVPLARLAETTSLITLVMFAIVNAALALIKAREPERRGDIFQVPRCVPWFGAFSCLLFLAAEAWRALV